MSDKLTIKQRADALAERAADAYSADNYTEAGWRGCALMLLKRGCDEQEAEEILRSKYTRWACDHSAKPYGRNNGNDLARYLDLQEGRTAKQIGRSLIETGN